MAIAYVQNKGTNDVAATLTIAATFGSSVTAGSAILLSSINNGAGTPTATVADNQGGGSNTYVEVINSYRHQAGDAYDMRTFLALNVGGGSALTVTVTWSASAQHKWLLISEWSGVATSGAEDKTAVNSGDGVGPPTSGSVTPTADNEMLVGFCWDQYLTTLVGGSGYTVPTTDFVNMKIEYFLQSTAAAKAADWGAIGTDWWLANIVTLKQAGGVAFLAAKPLIVGQAVKRAATY